jgi:hypothetical protein
VSRKRRFYSLLGHAKWLVRFGRYREARMVLASAQDELDRIEETGR